MSISVATASDLNNVRNNLSGDYIQTADIDLSGYSNWTPIGTGSSPFTGIYDGGNFKITGLTINNDVDQYIGLFGFVSGTLKNINIVGCNVAGTSTSANPCVGALCGNAHLATIQNCSSSGTVITNYFGGGLIGIAENTSSTTTIVDKCSSSCSVSVPSGNSFADLGGLVGVSQYSQYTKSYATGNVNGAASGWSEAGGFAGVSQYGNLADCYSTGTVSGSGDTGGFNGVTQVSTLTNCYSAGAVSSTGGTGGFTSSSYQSTYTSCYYDSQTSGQSDSGKGEPKTTAQMKTQSTFINWDFNTVWAIQSSYPFLRWQTPSSPRISSNMELVYDLGGSISSTLEINYNMGGKVSTPLEINYEILNRVSQSAQLNYNIRSRVTSSVGLLYSIIGRITKSIQLQYNILKRVSKITSLKYNISNRVTSTITTLYNVNNFVGTSLQLLYNVDEALHIGKKRLQVLDSLGGTVAYLTPDDGVSNCQPSLLLNGVCQLTFNIASTSTDKLQYLVRGAYIIADGRKFVIRRPPQQTKTSYSTYLVTAEEDWTTLNRYYPTVKYDSEDRADMYTVSIPASDRGQGGFAAGTAGSALYKLLHGCAARLYASSSSVSIIPLDIGWTVGTVDVEGVFDLEYSKKSLLDGINLVQQTWGGYLVWDSIARTVSLRDEQKWQPYTGFALIPGKNRKQYVKQCDEDVITRLIPFGADDRDIAGINGGLPYIEDYSYTDEVIEEVWVNQNITTQQQLIAAGRLYLNYKKTPRYTYTTDMLDLREMPGYEHETFALGDIVDLWTDEGIEKQRIVGLKYDFFCPWICQFTLGIPGYTADRAVAELIKSLSYVPVTTKSTVPLSNLEKPVNTQQFIDQYGINPLFIQSFNKCQNSSFELFDTRTLRPLYWSGGVSDGNSAFDGDYSLLLHKGEMSEQQDEDGAGLPDTSWWPGYADTRITFRYWGADVKVEVYSATGVAQVLTDNNGNAGTSLLCRTPANGWEGGYVTFKFTLPSSRFKVRFTNVGNTDLHIDAVQESPDYSGKWPAIYTGGPHSYAGGASGVTYVERWSAPWTAGSVVFILENGYVDKPVGFASSSDGNGCTWSYIQEVVGGTGDCYSKVVVTPKVTSPTPPAGTEITFMGVCTGMVKRS